MESGRSWCASKLSSLEGKLSAAGITTVFNGASFSDRATAASGRNVHVAQEMCAAVEGWNERETAARLVDHLVLHCLRVRLSMGLAAMQIQFEDQVRSISTDLQWSPTRITLPASSVRRPYVLREPCRQCPEDLAGAGS